MCKHVGSCRHNIDTASEEPTRLDVANMLAPTHQHVVRHVVVFVVLGGGNPQHNANITSQAI